MNTVQQKHLWKFARGEAELQLFEAWLYSDEELESVVDGHVYLRLISCDFSDPEAVRQCRKELWSNLAVNKQCECESARNFDTIRVFRSDLRRDDFVHWNYDQFVATQDTSFKPSDELDWRYISRCKVCGTNWLVNHPPRNFDGNSIERVSDQLVEDAKNGAWPPIGTKTFG
ncbi:hypothetical protein MWU60_02070 [Yoonia sp. F2084L]|uniref:hypothetical protein n=1 Tax=Yoonia sp. F2084L TaxID=2926419 RepID=UPI001FF34F40|nr:hypothetical protein [Yoonia sp. F2084L]MCK0094343.1 hypothetical protein [Yoonia sp. F2084L]